MRTDHTSRLWRFRGRNRVIGTYLQESCHCIWWNRTHSLSAAAIWEQSLHSHFPAPNVAPGLCTCAYCLPSVVHTRARDMPSEASQQPRESLSQSTDDASTRLTPSDNDSDDDLSMVEDKDAYELRPISGTGITTEDDEGLRDSYDNEDGPRLTSRASVQSYELYTPDEDEAVLKKLDRRLVGFMALLYCLSFLDRSSKLHTVVDKQTLRI